MNCMYCGRALKGFADTRMVDVHGYKVPACIDVDECNERAAAAEAARCAGEPVATGGE